MGESMRGWLHSLLPKHSLSCEQCSYFLNLVRKPLVILECVFLSGGNPKCSQVTDLGELAESPSLALPSVCSKSSGPSSQFYAFSVPLLWFLSSWSKRTAVIPPPGMALLTVGKSPCPILGDSSPAFPPPSLQPRCVVAHLPACLCPVLYTHHAPLGKEGTEFWAPPPSSWELGLLMLPGMVWAWGSQERSTNTPGSPLCGNREEQNLVAYPHDGKIYFCTSQDIPPENELLFYYSRDYAQQIGVPEHPDVHVCTCGKECNSYAEFKAHLSSHIQQHLPSQSHGGGGHGPPHSKERKWKCSMCPQAFTSPSKLHVHFMGHMGMKPHKCDFCSKAFSDPSNLRTHLKIHTGQKNYRCALCDKSFTQKAHLECHMVIHTGEKNLKCDYCDKLFMRRQDLKQHVLTHTQERHFKCPKCEKLFLRTNHLTKHLNSHEGKRDYICEKCSKAYLTKYHLTRHLKICKGPASSSSAQEEEEEDESEEEEPGEAAGAEGCRLGGAVYAAAEVLPGRK